MRSYLSVLFNERVFGGLEAGEELVGFQVVLERFASQLHGQVPVLLFHCLDNKNIHH